MKDIRTGTLPAEWSYQSEFVELGGLAYFRGYDRIHGSELWRTDGTADGTVLVRDLCPGLCSSVPSELTLVGGTVFFRASDGAHGSSLWKTDGTAAGTVRVKDVEPSRLAAFGTLLAFAASSPGQGEELWRSDGTAAGTLPLGDLRPGPSGSSPRPLGVLASELLFNADDGTHGRELWKTDGTAAGTALVEDINPGSGSGFPSPAAPEPSAVAGGRLLFQVGDGTAAPQLWASDGTAAGTSRLGTVVPFLTGDAPFANLGDTAWFSGSGGLWKSNGTDAGTVRVKEIPSPLYELTTVGDHLYFWPEPGFGSVFASLWSSDGTEAGTAQVPLPSGLSIFPPRAHLLALNGELVFYGLRTDTGIEPWKTDGTEAGTVLLADIYPGSAISIATERGKAVGGLWFFRAETPDGSELWASDGTPLGTRRVKRIDQSDASGLNPEIASYYGSPLKAGLGGTLLFSADDGTVGGELWRSDGTDAGTFQVKATGGLFVAELTPFDGRIFFGSSQLWSSDGTEAGTISYSSAGASRDLTPAGGQLYFATSGFADEIRKIGPSEPDTTQVKFINPGLIGQLTAVGPRLFFIATEGGGFGLWTSDGTEAGTVQIPGVASPDGLTAHRGALIFSAVDGTAGQELWTSDGTEAGTHRLKDILPGTGSSNPHQITSAGSLVFFVANDGVAGEELWKTDGTEAGTALVADIHPGAEPSWIHEITAFGSRVLFAADDGVHGVELWISDGTEAGTHLLKDAVPGAGSSYPRYLNVSGHLLYFAADDGTHGLEPWKTDGTEAGTAMLQDVNPGEAPSTPSGFVISGPWLYFTANDGAHGFELCALDRAADFYTVPPCRVFDTRSTTALGSSASRTFDVAGVCGIPSGAQAVAANLTVIGASGNGRVVVYPAGSSVPATSTLNFQAGVTRANNGMIGLTGGQVDALA
ncbi:MAG TPA: ELWxxDGT repeat protein, partial [Thermoanaerobaculia bacterium]|nr:ELWxxDGT repeat protein [Thermoanaerobaculia bacterium]